MTSVRAQPLFLRSKRQPVPGLGQGGRGHTIQVKRPPKPACASPPALGDRARPRWSIWRPPTSQLSASCSCPPSRISSGARMSTRMTSVGRQVVPIFGAAIGSSPASQYRDRCSGGMRTGRRRRRSRSTPECLRAGRWSIGRNGGSLRRLRGLACCPGGAAQVRNATASKRLRLRLPARPRAERFAARVRHRRLATGAAPRSAETRRRALRRRDSVCACRPRGTSAMPRLRPVIAIDNSHPIVRLDELDVSPSGWQHQMGTPAKIRVNP